MRLGHRNIAVSVLARVNQTFFTNSGKLNTFFNASHIYKVKLAGTEFLACQYIIPQINGVLQVL